jgi:molecular chaperone GrpE
MSASEQESQGPVIRDRRRIDPVTGQPRGGAGGSPPEPAPQQAQSAEQAQANEEARAPEEAPATEEARTPEQARAGDGSAGQTPRGPGQSRPGKHAASKPGSLKTEAARGSATSTTSDGPASASPGAGSRVLGESDQPKPADKAGVANQQSGGPDVAAMLVERTADLQRVQAEYANYRKRVERDRVAVREHALASVVTELLPVLDDIGRAREHDELTGGFKAVADALESAVSKLGLTMFGEPGEPFDPNVHEALMHSYSPDVTEPTNVQILQPGYKVGERILRPARVAVAEPTDPSGARTAAGTEEDLDADQNVTASESNESN